MKKGFSLLTAIIFIVLLSTIGVLALSLSSQNVKQTSDAYLKTQAELLAISATEYAVMAMTAHEINATNGCLNTIDATYPNATNPMFNIRVDIRYFGNGLPIGCDTMADNVINSDSNVTAQVDTYVTSATGIASEPIRFHRRTLQRP